MSKRTWIIIIVLAVLLLAGSFAYFRYKKIQAIKPDQNQRYAVFLSNDQVYFGFLKKDDDRYIVLEDIYYLKSNTSTQPDGTGKLSLIKWGDEIHGPENQMSIVRDQVLYMTKMKTDSRINDAIKKFQQNGSVSQ